MLTCNVVKNEFLDVHYSSHSCKTYTTEKLSERSKWGLSCTYKPPRAKVTSRPIFLGQFIRRPHSQGMGTIHINKSVQILIAAKHQVCTFPSRQWPPVIDLSQKKRMGWQLNIVTPKDAMHHNTMMTPTIIPMVVNRCVLKIRWYKNSSANLAKEIETANASWPVKLS